jgi:hypothetical protein
MSPVPAADKLAEQHRMLVAAAPARVQFVATTYAFNEVRIAPVAITAGDDAWAVAADHCSYGSG